MWRCATISSERLWTPSIFQVDATWLALTAAYLITIAALGRRVAAERVRPVRDNRALRFWAFAFGVILIMLLNRLFNLQFLLTLAARCAALDEGWYGDRRPFQFLIMLLSFAAGAGVALLAFLRHPKWDERLVLFGLISLVLFAAIRSLSFHWVDIYLRMKIFGLNFNGLTEGAALAPLLVGAGTGRGKFRLSGR